MEYGAFSKDQPMRHGLAGGYALVSAPERAFGINYAVYRNANPEFEDFLEYGADLEGLNYCFWILKGHEKIGGVIIRPNHIEGLFLRPPHTNARHVLESVIPLLRSWSDKTTVIEAVDVMPCELGLYQAMGFAIDRARRVYIRPTERVDVWWGKEYATARPSIANAAELASLLHASFRDYPNGWKLGEYSLQEWLNDAETRLLAGGVPAPCELASTLVYDKKRKLLVGACVVRVGRCITRPGTYYARVAIIAVHPEYRRRGLGGNMLKEALAALDGQCSTLRFGVAVGNSAEAFYQKLGFLPGVCQHYLVLGAAKRDEGSSDNT